MGLLVQLVFTGIFWVMLVVPAIAGLEWVGIRGDSVIYGPILALVASAWISNRLYWRHERKRHSL